MLSNTYSSLKNRNLKLTKQGKLQAVSVGHFLQNVPIDHAYTSPFSRAKKTAKLANESLNIEIVAEPRFGERILFTKDNLSENESKLEFEKSQKNWNYHTDEGESLNGVVKRFSEAISTILADHTAQNIAVFTHGRAMQSYLHSIFSLAGFGMAELIIEPASIYRVDYEDTNPTSYTLLFVPIINSITNGHPVPTLADTLVQNIKNTHILKTHLTPDSMAHDVQKNIYEYKSLHYLETIGIKVPGDRKLIDSGKYLQMEFIEGITLGEALSNNTEKHKMLRQVGGLLNSIHTATRKNSPPHSFLINAPNGSVNAQCAVNFRQHTANWLSANTKVLGDSETNTAFITVLKQASAILDTHPEYLVSNDIIHGDFKPDNILIKKNRLYVIDPHLSYGRFSCDLAKMIARIYLVNPQNAEHFIHNFLDGYDLSMIEQDEVRHMAAFDVLNTYSRLISKSLFNKDTSIQSHLKTIDNMTFCLKEIVPKLLGTSS